MRWSATLRVPVAGSYTLSFAGDDGFRVRLDGKTLIDRWQDGAEETRSAVVQLRANTPYKFEIEFFQSGGEAVARLNWISPAMVPYADAVTAAKKADVVIVCVSTRGTEGEGRDRSSMDLPNDQNELIRKVVAANKNTVVVLNNGTPIGMKTWLLATPAVIETWYPGQEGGAALAAVLFGQVNPSGKLPSTFAAERRDYPDYGNFPGRNGHVNYAEGIYVGYRYFDKKGIAPLFPFGHGLSYTTFGYSKLNLSSPGIRPGSSVLVKMDVKNTGQRAGEEVVQLYLRDRKPQIDRPVRELKSFAKIALQPGEFKTVSFQLTPRDFAYFDVAGKEWKANAGTYDIEVGASSRDIRLRKPVILGADFNEAVLHLQPR